MLFATHRWIWQHSLSDVDFESWAGDGDHGVRLDILRQGLDRLLNVPLRDLMMTVPSWIMITTTIGWLSGKKITVTSEFLKRF